MIATVYAWVRHCTDRRRVWPATLRVCDVVCVAADIFLNVGCRRWKDNVDQTIDVETGVNAVGVNCEDGICNGVVTMNNCELHSEINCLIFDINGLLYCVRPLEIELVCVSL